MIRRVVLCALAAAMLAAAGLRISIVENGQERLLSSACTLPAAEVGSVVPVKFRIRSDPDKLMLDHLDLKATDLYLIMAPSLPLVIWPGAYIDVDVEYRPSLPGSGAGSLEVNDRTITIVTQALPAPEVRTESGDVLYPGEPYEFGEVPLGSSITRHFRVDNPTGVRATVTRLDVVGTGFRAAIPPVPFQIEAGESAAFDVTFEPQSQGRLGAFLHLNSREYSLQGTATAPPLSKPELVIEPGALQSGMQAEIAVRLASPVEWPVEGVLRMDFDGRADSSMCFLHAKDGDGRVLTFSIDKGESVASFASGNTTAEAADFGTGSTAGRITFTAELGPYSEELAVDIAPAVVQIDETSPTAKRASSSVEVRFSALDNTLTASSVAFTFRDTSGRQIGTGPIRIDASSDFRTYFDASQEGGTFSLRAVFPVRGDISQIGSVDIGVTNSQGASAPRSVTLTE